MKNLEARIIRLEAARSDPVNDFFHSLVCRFADAQGKPGPEKQDDIALTLKQLGEVLPL